MKRIVLALSLAFSLGAFAAPPPNFEQRVETLRERIGVPGIAISIVENDQVTFAKGFGVRKLYALFFMNELLRRLKWHSDGNSDIDVGATVPELWLAMNRVLEKVPA